MISGFPLQQGSTYSKEKHYVTLQKAGKDKYGIDVLPKSAWKVKEGTISAVSYNETTKIWTITLAAHLAKGHDFVRFLDNTEAGTETPIFNVPTANTIQLYGKGHLETPSIGDTIQVLRWVTPQADFEGGIAVSVPTAPAQFVFNGSNQQVVMDEAVAANNIPMPNLVFIQKDGVYDFIRKDTGTPANTLAMPVEIVAASGTPITITAGDINIQLTDLGANFDACRIGDGTGNYIAVNASGEASVHDADLLTAVGLLAKLSDTQPVSLASVPLPAGAATAAKQDLLLAELQLKADLTETQPVSLASVPLPAGAATAAKQDLLLAELQLKADLTETQPVSVASLPLPSGAATEATLSAMKGYEEDGTGSGTISAVNAVPNGPGAATANSTVEITVKPGASTAVVQTVGAFTGTLNFQGTVDGSNWITILAAITRANGAVVQNIASAQGIYSVKIAGYLKFRMSASALSAGTPVVSIIQTRAEAQTSMDYGLPPGGQVIGSVGQSGTWTLTPSSNAGTITSVQAAVGLTAVRATVAGTAPSASRKKLMVKPSAANTGKIYIGPSGVTTANGMEIIGPDRLEFEFDAGDYYLISDTAAQVVEILEKV
jgi:hypothetical protein